MARSRTLAPRPLLPGPIAPAELQRLQASLPTSTWRMTLNIYPQGGNPGFGDQSRTFATELLRLGAGRVSLQVLGDDLAVRDSELRAQLQGSTDLIAWSSPVRRGGLNSAYYVYAGLPLGKAPAEHAAWLRAGGNDLLEQLHWVDGLNYRVVPCGIGVGAGGWYRREITAATDFRGLRTRTSGLVTSVVGRLGAQSTTLQANSTTLRTAFAANTLDAFMDAAPFAATFLPRTQQRQGQQGQQPQGQQPQQGQQGQRAPQQQGQQRPVAGVYHYPSWHAPSLTMILQIPDTVWTAMGEPLQRIVDEACRSNIERWITESATVQQSIADQARAAGVTVKPFPQPVLDALRRATDEVLADEAQRNPEFRTALDHYRRFSR